MFQVSLLYYPVRTAALSALKLKNCILPLGGRKGDSVFRFYLPTLECAIDFFVTFVKHPQNVSFLDNVHIAIEGRKKSDHCTVGQNTALI